MKYFIIFTIMSIAGTAGVALEKKEIPVEHFNFDPIYITVDV
tara:strand:+ start:3531 stop:3656 length:126 start_codon:yes stop_codon:yes gene_type:complete